MPVRTNAKSQLIVAVAPSGIVFVGAYDFSGIQVRV